MAVQTGDRNGATSAVRTGTRNGKTWSAQIDERNRELSILDNCHKKYCIIFEILFKMFTFLIVYAIILLLKYTRQEVIPWSKKK